MSSTDEGNVRRGATQDQSAMVRNIVATIMESQAETITRMANEAIQTVMGEKEERLADELEERLRKKEKRARTEFTSEGNKQQYKHQKELLENLEDVDKATDLINEGKKLIEKKIKLIKIADREGRETVKEYVFYSILFYSILFYSILFYSILFYSSTLF